MGKRFPSNLPDRWHPTQYSRFVMPALTVLVFGGLGIYFLTGGHAAPITGGAVQIYLTPASASVVQGQTVDVAVHVKTNGENINAVQADLSYPAGTLQYTSSSNVCANPPFGVSAQNTGGSGNATIACGSFSGVNGDFVMGTITFTALATGSAPITVLNTSSALRSTDNAETLGTVTGATVTVTAPAPTISSLTPVTGSSLGGTPVTITGTNFSGTPTVKFGTVNATSATVVNATTITATAPANNPGVADVSVTIGGQTATKTAAFTYSDVTAPTAPGTPTATANEMYRIALSWTASTDTGGSNLAGYRVYRDGTLLTASPVTATTYNDTTVMPLTAYSYTVEAVDGAGNVSARSAALAITSRRLGDITADGTVGTQDLARLLIKYGQTVPAGTPEDLDRDGKVALTDLSIMLTNFGK